METNNVIGGTRRHGTCELIKLLTEAPMIQTYMGAEKG